MYFLMLLMCGDYRPRPIDRTLVVDVFIEIKAIPGGGFTPTKCFRVPIKYYNKIRTQFF